MTEYGIFSDEGLLEDGFYRIADAERVMARDYAEDNCHVGEMSRDQDACEAGYEDEIEEEDDDE